MTDAITQSDPELAAAVWDLQPLVDGEGDAGVTRLLEQAQTRATDFASSHAGTVAKLDADGLVAAATELAEIRDLISRAAGYADLRAAADSNDPSGGALQGSAEAVRAEIDSQLLFFELEWVALGEAQAEALLSDAGDRLSFAAHHLRRLRARRPHLLSAEAERILAETGVQRLSAWKRLYLENAASLMIDFDGESVPVTHAFSVLTDPRRERRLAAMAATGQGTEVGLPTRVAAYNQVLGEKAIDDRLRGYPSWLSSRNLANEATDAAVAIQVATITARQDIPRRWNRLKAQLLGVERLATADLLAPLPSVGRTVGFAESRALVSSAWASFSPRAEALITAFFAEGRIDGPIRPGKQGGAFCAETGSTRHAYVLVNYDSRPFGTMMLAHELGHGLHFELSREQGSLQQLTSIPMLEVASTFSEALVSEQLMTAAADDRERLSLLAARLDDAMGNVFLTCAYQQAEAALHAHRRATGELSGEEICRIWVAALTELWGDTMEVERAFELWWSLLPHMISEPGYFYSYSYGLLVAWSAYARYQDVGEPFAEQYLAMLAAGGSRSPADLVAMIGLDVNDPGFWNAGLDLCESMLSEAERLAASLEN